MRQRNILFPIELISRELDYKLLVAAYLLEEEGEITFCQHDLADRLMRKAKGGVYLGKNVINPRKYSIYKKYKENDFLIIHLDEEGGVYPGPIDILFNNLKSRVDINSLSPDDFVCTWGVTQEEFYKSNLNSDEHVNICTTGHCRFDMYREPYRAIYRKESDRLREVYGPYILINTHFSFANNNAGLGDTFSSRTGYGQSPETTSRIVEEWAEEAQKTSHFISLIHHLTAELPNTKFVLRPHPDEDLDFYKTTLDGIDNLMITNDGPVGPWIIGAELLIHDRCTTAIEAFFADVPVINHKIMKNKLWDNKITSEIGLESSSNSETTELVKLILADREKYTKVNRLKRDQFSIIRNFEGNQFPEFIEFLDRKVSNKIEISDQKIPSIYALKFNECCRKLLERLKKPLRYLFFARKQREYIASKSVFPGFDAKKIRNKLDVLEGLTSKSFEMKSISEQLFILRRSK